MRRVQRRRPTDHNNTLWVVICLLLATLAVGGALAGCRPRRPVEREGGTLHLLLPRAVANLDPHRATLGTPLHSALFDTLLVRGVDNLPRPGLAKAWQVSTDGLVVSLELRQGAFFHDGTPVTATAVVKNIERILAAPSEQFPIRSLLGPLREARADGQQVSLIYDTPFPPVWAALTDPRLGIVASATLVLLDEPSGAAAIPAASFAGSGPYRLVESRADAVELARYSPYAWPPATAENPGAAYPDRLMVFLAGDEKDPDPSSLPSGKVPQTEGPAPDVVWWPAGEAAPEFTATPGAGGADGEWMQYPFGGSRLIYLAVDTQRLPLADPVVRQALSMAIDRQALLAEVEESVSVTASLIPSGLPGSVAAGSASSGPVVAADILERAGWVLGSDGVRQKDGVRLEVRLATYEDNEQYIRLADSICGVLRQAGVACRRVAARRYFDPDLVEGAPNLWLLFYDWPDPDVLHYLFHSSEIGSSNRSRYQNPQVDVLLSAARQDMDPLRRAEMYREAQVLITGDAAAIPLFESRGTLLISPRVAGFTPQAPGSLLLHDLYLRFR